VNGSAESSCGNSSIRFADDSNHEKPVAVAPELFDEAIFPVEMGLHKRHEIMVAIGPPME
jgi:hypothetical protein